MQLDWLQVITAIGGVIAFIFAFAKWFMDWAEKRDAQQEEHFNLQLQNQKKELEKIHARIDEHDDELIETRQQMVAEYSKQTDIIALRAEIRDDLKGVYQKLGGIDRAVNQLIGIIKVRFSDD